MPNIFKAFSRTKAEPYQLPDIEELVMEEVPGRRKRRRCLKRRRTFSQ